MDRWHMSRAGIFNFWYYDEEEFHFEEGRLILRGTNGSGKSVTMQSLIPLVLDGDKRPQRLDPFGSRDRRLEYYLLGDGNEGHTDRTGYLWLEFYHPVKKIYKTIGIGLRARRAVTVIGFWGFLLEDNRRIGEDFYLYDYNLWLEEGKKVPLNRKSLEEQIASGGQVIQGQGAYQEMVNKALFGFREIESYKDLLKLLLELRSPKLSKDFKPSSIYEILNNSLPPLMEEDLSSLSDVLEEMDQITDRLDELLLYLEEISRIEKSYNSYNQFLLQQASTDVIQKWKAYNKNNNQVEHIQTELKQLEEDRQRVVRQLDDYHQRLGIVEMELETLNQGEAVGKQRELELVEEQLKEVHKQLQSLAHRLKTNEDKLERLKKEILKLNNSLNQIVNEQDETISELEDIARIIEFHEHDIYHGLWNRAIPEEERWHKSWLQDLEAHKKKLALAQQTAREEGEASRAAKEMEIQLGEVHKERHRAEGEQAKQAEHVESTKEGMRELLVRWYQELKHIPAQGEQLRESLRALTSLTTHNRQYEPIRQPAVQAYEQKKEAIMQQKVQLNQERLSVQAETTRLEEELNQWRVTREPEPRRTDNRDSARKQRGTGRGAPLYTVCEFNENLTDIQQAQLEETLDQAGLLDAWILPGGQVGVLDQEHNEEVWFQPVNQIKGTTLSSVLYATPTEKSGLSAEDITSALNSIGWNQQIEQSTTRIETAGAFIAETGEFKLGPISGKNSSKSRSEFIGEANRLRTKELEMAKLQAEIQYTNEQLQVISQQLELLTQHQQEMDIEFETFPQDLELQKQLESLMKITFRLEQFMIQEQKVEERYKKKVSDWRELQLRLTEQTAEWSLLKKEHQITEAIELSSAYQSRISDLYSYWEQHRSTLRLKDNQEEQQVELLILVEGDQMDVRDREDQRVRMTAQVDLLKELVKSMGIEEIHERITRYKEERNTIKHNVVQLQNDKEQKYKILGEVSTTLKNEEEKLNKIQSELDDVIALWKMEITLALLPIWKTFIGQIEAETSILEIVKCCEQITKEYANLFTNLTRERMVNDLTQEFHKGKTNLQDYVLEMDHGGGNSSRIILLSKRDRMNPMTPTAVLHELTQQIEEQQILLTAKDRNLYEEIIIGSVGKAIRNRIHRARSWVDEMDQLMKQRNTSSGLKLSLKWEPLERGSDNELDTTDLVDLLMLDANRMDDEQIEQVITHFRTKISRAKEEAQKEDEVLRKYIYSQLDYRSWFQFKLEHLKGERTNYTELTDRKFNVLSGGEKAMAMYIPLFVASYSRYSDADTDAPKIISLDEAFAGVDDANMRDMFHLLTDMGFDYIMTSQVLWGCYDTVPNLAIYEIHRPKDTDIVTLFHYRWDGESKILMD
ncbi:TIGR02680 family protein [Paenibacillus polymyxa]|uniref:TIGR02680 family protein n=1 Tax=Paenibacillus polymyxa TaxID=1406 RepID=UPI00298C1C55|nr:TIGR02680 family protein [Paenibacillus polymyxa]